jgi:hypothetical protein
MLSGSSRFRRTIGAIVERRTLFNEWIWTIPGVDRNVAWI